MKKPLSLLLLLILLIISFVGGTRYSQHGDSQKKNDNDDRQILHYVDPMNPANTSKEPGIAPCGMPMEPIYADEDSLSGRNPGGLALSSKPGIVKINAQKQQIIGVQIDGVTKDTQTSRIRALGRILPDENKVYALVAATDGWMGEVHESTTGSLVSKNQLMGKIRVYDYDFFTWQQRYLTELGNAGRRRVFVSNTSGAEDLLKKVISTKQKAGSVIPDIGAPIALTSIDLRGKNDTEETSPMMELASPTAELLPPTPPTKRLKPTTLSSNVSIPWGIPPGAMHYGETPIKPSPSASLNTSEHHTDMPLNKDQNIIPPPVTEQSSPKPRSTRAEHVKNMTEGKSGGLFFTAEDDILYASKARQELMDLGVDENQLAQLAESGVYLTYVELRSPVDGLVLSRNVTTRQRIDRGAECFRVADLSRVWVETDIYDIEAKYIQPGMSASISMPKMGKHFAAKVSEVLPRYDAAGRSLKVRLEMDNPAIMFRPDMFVDVEFLLDLQEAITVPSGAVIDSGKRKTVYVVLAEGIFEPRSVITGWRFNDRVEIIEGLKLGEKIVVSGNFLIDSESRMKMAAARLMEDTFEIHSADQPAVMPQPQTAMHSKLDTVPHNTVKDLVCGMNINQADAIEAGLTLEVEGTIYYFCSEECAEEFHRHGPQIIEIPDSKPTPDTTQNHRETGMEQLIMPMTAPHIMQEPTTKDPVCGMIVNKDTASSAGLTIKTQDGTHYFCSEDCKEQFNKDPQDKLNHMQIDDAPEHMGHKP